MGSIIAENKGGNFAIPESGTFVARCVSMIEIGTITTEIKGIEKRMKKVSITWELPTELHVFDPDKGEQPFVVSKEYTLSMNSQSNLRHDLESWRGKKYEEAEAEKVDITKLLGQPCQISIIHEPSKKDASKIYANVSSVTKLMKGTVCPPQINPAKLLAYDDWNWDVFESLSDYMKNKIRSSEEFQAMQSPGEIRDESDKTIVKDEDLPF